ncbi:hypothetical protein Ppa06_57790 [Planomonospora parontospora subsp. parontospora]|uniref:Lipoprotein n=2 Tax=Planomonospora parontospora TaxID=58119 RepID=A0AA37F785_9ACTN|nr:hypothetical protein [Planomonospora parontospora]GGK90579.1 hypothetical protein GCM10010126_57520 [Planomonospora parontospora]GII11981.1 hypothetical protein Ppa06_57790 [Planomonospora parontospora subsp. parontospora]
MRNRTRKSSSVIQVTGLATLSALVLAACTVEETVVSDCVETASRAPDGSYRVVDDRYCEGGSHHGYSHYYGGSSAGGRVHSGTTVRPGNVTITTRSGTVISRGGFGGRGTGGAG